VTAISIEKFSELVEAIYAAALDPTEWSLFGRLLTEATNSALAGVGILDMTTTRFLQTHGYGVPDGYFERLNAVSELNPLLPYAALSKPGDLLVNSAVITEDEFVKSRFYREFSEPLGLRDSMGLVCLRSGPRIAFLVANRAASQPLYTDADGDLLRLLSPHICRAMTISDAFDLHTIKSDALEAALDGLAAGVFLVDGQGRVIHQNRAAERMAQQSSIVTVRDQRLWPLNSSSRAALVDALSQGAQRGIPATADVPMIALQPSDGSSAGMIATLLPLQSCGQATSDDSTKAQWAVFIQDPHVVLPMPGEAFGKLYNLTPAELRVALALAPGLTPEAAADMLGLGLPTVRTHLQRIFAKTGTNRHTDFVRLMLATMPPIAGPAPSGPSLA
jgi:DNA-binding CsgD family transcriptional regulator/PAS domain-containing protein